MNVYCTCGSVLITLGEYGGNTVLYLWEPKSPVGWRRVVSMEQLENMRESEIECCVVYKAEYHSVCL